MCDLPLSSIAEVNPTVRIPRNLSGKDAVSFIPMGDVSESGHWTFKQIRPLRSIAAGFTAFNEGDILVAKITPCMENGKGAHALGLENGLGFGSTEFHVLRARPGNAQRFVFHLTQWRKFRHAAEGQMVGSAGQQRVPRSFFDEFLVANFDPDEQSTLAKILDTLDTAIHETEAIIAKLKAVKQGLLHDLLTRGIDANGELRPPQAEAPHLYKTSRVGLIPKTWELRGVLDVAPEDRQSILTGPFGADLGQSDFRPEGVPVLRIGNVQSGFIDWSDTQYVTQHKANSLAKYLIQEGDLLFARQGATTGRNALADARADGAVINYHIIRVAVDKARCHPSYLYAVFNSDNTKSQVDQVKGRGTREGINSAQIAALSFALPQPEEQLEAVKRMASIDESIRSESALRANLLLQKISLMDDLLTGRVRVTPLLEAAE